MTHKGPVKKKRHEYYIIHKDQEQKKRRQRYDANKDYELEKHKQYCQANKESIKQYYQANKDLIVTQNKQYYQANKEYKQQYQKRYGYIKRGLGFKPLNNHFKGAAGHHLLLENSKDFLVFLPYWDHELNPHKSIYPESMITINAIALDYWVNESLYNELFLP